MTRRLGWREVLKIGFVVTVIGVWMVTLRPQTLGGPAAYVIVHGESMLPTFEEGDLLMVSAQASYGQGDVIGYRVPRGEVGEGRLVVHRIIGGSAASYDVAGDNNSAPDPWHPAESDIAGRVVLRLPGVGSAIVAALQPAAAAALATAVVVMLLLARSPSSPGPSDRSLRPRRSSSAAADPAGRAREWPSAPALLP